MSKIKGSQKVLTKSFFGIESKVIFCPNPGGYLDSYIFQVAKDSLNLKECQIDLDDILQTTRREYEWE